MRGFDISIVIPVRNRPQLLMRCLDSVKAQSWRPLNVIVVDNGSTDNTMSEAELWAAGNSAEDFRVAVMEESAPGATAARNRGLEAVDTEYVMFFDSDDMMHPDLVKEAMTAFKKNPEGDIVHWQSQSIDENGKCMPRKFTDSDYWRSHLYHSLLSTQCFASRTDYFRKIGAWNVTLPVWNDWELGVRILLGNPVLLPVKKILADVYPQKESITGTDFHSKCGEWEMAIDAAEDAVIMTGRSDAAWIADILNYRRVILAAHYRHEGYKGQAEKLLRKSLSHGGLKGWRKLLLHILYLYTSNGGRGAYIFWR